MGEGTTPERVANEYLHFEEGPSASGKTLLVVVRSVRTKQILGQIAWWGPWRQYTFRPEPNTIWNTGCMATVIAYIEVLMAERAEQHHGS